MCYSLQLPALHRPSLAANASEPAAAAKPASDIPIRKQFPNRDFPLGEVCKYKDEFVAFYLDSHLAQCCIRSNLQRETNAEVRAREMIMDEDLKDLRQAAEAHRQVILFLSTLFHFNDV